MPLSTNQILRGAQVAITHDEEGNRLPIERRGYIYAVDTALKIEKVNGKTVITRTERNGNPNCGVKTIWVRLKKGEEPIPCKNVQLTLIHEASRKAFDEIRREEQIKKAKELEAKNRETDKLEASPEADEEIPIVIPEEPIVTQELTPEAEGRALTADDIRKLEAGEEIEPEAPTVVKRVIPQEVKKL